MMPRQWLGTLAIVAIYADVMTCSNSRFTILDDEANSVAIAGRPIVAALLVYRANVIWYDCPQ